MGGSTYFGFLIGTTRIGGARVPTIGQGSTFTVEIPTHEGAARGALHKRGKGKAGAVT